VQVLVDSANAEVVAIGDVDVAVRIGRQADGRVESRVLARSISESFFAVRRTGRGLDHVRLQTDAANAIAVVRVLAEPDVTAADDDAVRPHELRRGGGTAVADLPVG